MALKECQSCGGHYTDVDADGVRYFHACPPLAAWEVRAALDAGTVTLTKRQAQQLAAADATPTDAKTGATGAQLGDAYLATLVLPRPNARNENIDPVKVKALRDPDTRNLPANLPDDALIVSAGAGALDVVALDEGLVP